MSDPVRRYTVHPPQLVGRLSVPQPGEDSAKSVRRLVGEFDGAMQELQRFLKYAQDANDSGQTGQGIVGVVGGTVDHGSTSGLTDDDHLQYLTVPRHNAIDAADHGSDAAAAGTVLGADGAGGASWILPTPEAVLQPRRPLPHIHPQQDVTGLDVSSLEAEIWLRRHLAHTHNYADLRGSQLLLSDGTAAAPSLAFASSTGTGLFRTSTGTGALVFEAANTLAQRNGTNNQTFRIYKTYTSVFTYEGLSIQPTAIDSMYAGGGSNNSLRVRAGAYLIFGSQGMVDKAVLDYTSFRPDTDNLIDFGSSTVRWKTGYFGGTAASVPLVIKLHASQTANAQEWQNSSGTPLAYVEKGGAIKGLGLIEATVAKTGAYLATINDHMIRCDATAAAFTVTLPAVATSTGLILHIKKVDATANVVTIDGNASELVEDALTQTLLLKGENLMLQCDGSQWWVL